MTTPTSRTATGPIAPRDACDPPAPITLPAATPWVAASIAALCAWAAAVWISPHVHADRALFDVALFVHIGALVLGLGAVLTLDTYAALWLTGHRTLLELCRLAQGVHALIWAGLVGLVVSGPLLHPHVDNTLTQLKLLLVLLIAVNGINAAAVTLRLRTLRGPPPRRLLARAACAATLSQAAWWAATIIGFINDRASHAA